MSYYGDISDARELARNILTTDFPNSEVQEHMDMWTQFFNLKTHSTWDSSNTLEFPIAKQYVIKRSAADIIEHYGGAEGFEYAKQLRADADLLLQGILEESAALDVDADELEISRTEFQTYPKNRDAKISRGRLSKVGYSGTDTNTTLYTSKYLDD